MPTVDSLKLKNFGIHRDRTFTFAEGFNVIRGANEAGKSTVLEAIAIAFFGNLALRGGWDDVVTTGEKVSSLYLEMRFGQYVVKRSKSSASVVSDDGQVKISGHNDVTDFFIRMFGVDKAAVKHVMIAEQGAIQGILGSGATDATKFIENLAGFEQIDKLVEVMKVKFPVIDGQALKQQESSLEVKLEEKKAEVLPDLEVSEANLGAKQNNKNIAQAAVDYVVDALDKQGVELEGLKEQKRLFDSAAIAVTTQEAAVNDLLLNKMGLFDQCKAFELNIKAFESQFESAQVFLNGLAEIQAEFARYQKIVEFEYCEETWDESFDALKAALESEKVSLTSFEAQVKANEKKVTQLESTSPVSEQLTLLTAKRDDISQQQAVLKAMNGDSDEVVRIKEALLDNKSAAMLAESKFAKDMVCPTCGSDLTETRQQLNEAITAELSQLSFDRLILEKDLKTAQQSQLDSRTQQEKDLNNEYTKTIRKLEKVISALEDANLAEIKKIETATNELQLQMAESESTIQSMEGIIECQNRVEDILREIGEVGFDDSVFPWTLFWPGDIPTKPDQAQITKANDDVVYYQGMVTQLEAKNTEYLKCCGDLVAAQIKLTELQKALELCKDKSEQIEKLVDGIAAAKVTLAGLREALDAAVAELNTATTRLALDEQAVKKHGEDVAEINKDIKLVQDQILKSAENNALHRAVAEARGKVIEGVWNTLLAATNDCFSKIRGEASEILRDGKFFRVNGIKTIRLSGSTLDSLGLALRSAIRDVFCPATDFMLLDEIAAGADQERTIAMMSQVACLSVGQKILVTHESLSEGLADSVIEV